MDTQWMRYLAVRVAAVLGLCCQAQAMDIAPIPGQWKYQLCQPLSYMTLYAQECKVWEEGDWMGPYKGGCRNERNPSPWADESVLIPKALAFYGDVSASFHGWLGESEALPYNGCWEGPPEYRDGVEISNVSRITTESASGSSHLFVTRRDRGSTCPAGYVANGALCRPAGVNPYKNNDACTAGLNGSNPIHTALGYKLQTEVDYRGPAPDDLRFLRYYSSGSHWAETPMGSHWRHTYARRISITAAAGLTTATVYRPNGDRYYFNLDDTGRWVSDPDVLTQLERRTDSDGAVLGWRYVDSDDIREDYDAAGRLIRITQRDGRTQMLDYEVPAAEGGDDDPRTLDRIVSDLGGVLAFGYDSEGHLASLIGPDDTVYRYRYDDQANLVEVRLPDDTPDDPTDDPTRSYHYEDPRFPHVLTGITDENGQRFASWTYDEQGRAITSQHAGGAERVELRYNPDGTTTVTNALGSTRTYAFELLHGVYRPVAIDGERCTSCGGQVQAYTYDPNGLLASKTDFNGVVTTYAYNARGLQTARTQALGTPEQRLVTTEWHPRLRLPVGITEPQRVTELRYLDTGLLYTRTERARTGQASRTWTYTYTPQGQVARIDGPRTDINDLSTFEYDARGRRIAFTNALGHTTRITRYDGAGRPLTIVDPNGVRTELGYDARGRLIRHTTGNGPQKAVTDLAYDGVGQLVYLHPPDGSVLHFDYDPAHHLVGVRDAVGNRIDTTLDPLGNRTGATIHDAGGTLTRVWSRVYDRLGQLIAVVGGEGQTTTYDYDANGNRTTWTDPLGRASAAAFDPLNRLIRQTDPGGGQIRYGHDPGDHLTSVTDPRGLTTTYAYDGLGNRIRQDSPDTGVTTFEYDPAGNRIRRTDARGISTSYTYDALNRVVSVDTPDPDLRIHLSYDEGPYGIGHLTGMSDASGTTRLEYDGRGNLVTRTHQADGAVAITRFEYDRANRLVGITYPSGLKLVYGRDPLGRIESIHATLDGEVLPLVEALAYQPFGPLKALRYGNGLDTRIAHDLDYRPTELTGATALARSHAYDAAGNLVAIMPASEPQRHQGFEYDELDRLIRETGPYGERDYSYDAVGNRLHRVRLTPRADGTYRTTTRDYTYAEASNRLLRIDRRMLTHDKAGNTLTDRNGRRTYSYDALGRLASVAKAGQLKAGYLYNGLGQRTTKRHYRADGQSRITRFHYAPDDTLLAERRLDQQGRVRLERDYVWLDRRPIARIQTRYSARGAVTHRRVLYLHADHLNTPRIATDAAQTVVWRWDSDAFGQGRPDRDPDGDGLKTTLPLRFPGQYHDRESGLYYNYFRDYDPSIGRYIESDPIGLGGDDLNTYEYVWSNPLYWIDREGLQGRRGIGAGSGIPGTASLGAGGAFFFGAFGGAAESGFVIDSTGGRCFYSMTCSSGGLGIYGGLGGAASIGLSNKPLSSGTSWSLGAFASGGIGFVGGLSGSVGLDDDANVTSISGVKGFGGKGGGVAIGIQACKITLLCNEDSSYCKGQRYGR